VRLRFENMPTATDDDLTRRALGAYFRTHTGIPDQPDGAASGVVEHGGHTYVVLLSVRGTLAVYRLLNDGRLKRMRRWPSAVAAR